MFDKALAKTKARIRWAPVWVGLVIVGALAWFLLQPPDGFLMGMYPVDGDRSVFLLRYNDDDTSKAWVGLVHADKGTVWHRELPALTYAVYGRHGLTVHADRVTVKVSDRDNYDQVLAYRLGDGEPLWSSEKRQYQPSKSTGGAPGVLGERPSDDGMLVLHVHNDGERIHLVARSPGDGATVWQHDVGDNVFRSFQTTAKFVLYRSSRYWTIVDRKSGAARRVDLYSDLCVEDDVAWGVYRGAVQRVDLAAGTLTSLAKVDAPGFAQTCGLFDGERVFAMTTSDRDAPDRTVLVGVDGQGRVAWRFGLGRWKPKSFGQASDTEGPDVHPMRGTITPFVAFLVSRPVEPRHALMVVDIKGRKVAWRSAPRDELLHYSVARGPDGVHSISWRDHLVAIDGASGKVTGSIVAPELESIRGFQATPSRLWVFSRKWSPITKLPWAVVDSRTLQPAVSGTDALPVDNVLAKTQERFGIPEAWVATR